MTRHGTMEFDLQSLATYECHDTITMRYDTMEFALRVLLRFV